jgi:hypothetical protein
LPFSGACFFLWKFGRVGRRIEQGYELATQNLHRWKWHKPPGFTSTCSKDHRTQT